jgi:hypothetical protein
VGYRNDGEVSSVKNVQWGGGVENMLWLLKRLRKNSEPRKRKKKGLVAILLIVGIIAFQNFAPEDSELRVNIEDLISSATDLLP